MKKFFLTFSLVFVWALASFAQLKVNGEGNVAVNTSEQPLSPLSVGYKGTPEFSIACETDRSGMFVRNSHANQSNWSYAGIFSNQSINSNFKVGVKGDATSLLYMPHDNGRSYGVMGLSGCSCNGWNFGVYGQLVGDRDGASIYGTIYPDELGRPMRKRFAGYFNGPTEICGDLNVTGAITHESFLYFLPDSTWFSGPSFPMKKTLQNEATPLEQLSQLQVLPYYVPNQVKPLAKAMADTGQVVVSKSESYFERQYQDKKHYGFKVEQLKALFPDLVYTDDEGASYINYSDLLPMLIMSIQDLQQRVVLLQEQLQGGNIESQTRKQDTTERLGYQSNSDLLQSLSIDKYQADVFDKDGRKVCSFEVSSQTDLTTELQKQVSTGVYLVSLTSQGRVQRCEKVVIP